MSEVLLMSMFARRSFVDFAHHFVEQLPTGQGPNAKKGRAPTGDRSASADYIPGDYVILFLDGHGSRWSYEGLQYLRANRVIVLCLPAHTSIWSQVAHFNLNVQPFI